MSAPPTLPAPVPPPAAPPAFTTTVDLQLKEFNDDILDWINHVLDYQEPCSREAEDRYTELYLMAHNITALTQIPELTARKEEVLKHNYCNRNQHLTCLRSTNTCDCIPSRAVRKDG